MFSRYSKNAAVFCLFLALAVVHTYPMVLNIGSETPLNLSSVPVAYVAAEQSILFFKEAPLSFSGALNPTITGPLQYPLLLCPYGFGSFLLFAPFFLLTGNLYFSANMFLLLLLSGSAFSMFLLARYLTGSARAAVIAGAVFVFSTPALALLRDVWSLNLIVFPLIFLNFIRFIDEQKKRYLFATAGFLALEFYLEIYHVIIAQYLLLSIALVKWRAVFAKKNVKAIFGASFVSVLLVSPLAVPYLLTSLAYGVDFRSTPAEHIISVFPGEWLTVAYNNVVYGDWLSRPRFADDPTVQVELFPGVLVCATALFGAIKGRYRSLSGLFLLSVAALAMLLVTSWYPFHFFRPNYRGNVPHLWIPLFRYLPFLEYIRVLGRYVVVINFCVAILVGGGYLELERRIEKKFGQRLAIVLFFLFASTVNVENLSVPRKMHTYDELFGPGEAVAWLNEHPVFENPHQGVLYIPFDPARIRPDVAPSRAYLDFLVPVFRHLYLRRPTYSHFFSYRPRGYAPAEAYGFPDVASQKFFGAIGIRAVVVYEALLDSDARKTYGKKNMTGNGLRHLATVGNGEKIYLLDRSIELVDRLVLYDESEPGRIRFSLATPETFSGRAKGGGPDPASAEQFWINPKHCQRQEIDVRAVDAKGRTHSATFSYYLPLVVGGKQVQVFEWTTKDDWQFKEVGVEYDEEYIVRAEDLNDRQAVRTSGPGGGGAIVAPPGDASRESGAAGDEQAARDAAATPRSIERAIADAGYHPEAP